MEHDHYIDDDHHESSRPVPDSEYSDLLEVMVKFGKRGLKGVEEEEETGKKISFMDWLDKCEKLESLSAMRARVIDQLKSAIPRVIDFWFLMTLMYSSEDKQVMAAKYEQFTSSLIAIDDLFDHEENYSQLMDLAGTELKKIKEQYPNQVGNMATASELHSTSELFLSLHRGMKSLLFKIKLVELHLLYPSRPQLHKLVDTMWSSVECEVGQYEQELDVAGAKVKEKLKNALEDKKELEFKTLELKVREWWNIVKTSQEGEVQPS